jgi:hypothetical protein
MLWSMYQRLPLLPSAKWLLLLGVAGGLLATIRVSSVAAQAEPKQAQPNAPVQTLSLTTLDNGRTIKVAAGSVISVNLSLPTYLPNYIWSVPRSSNGAVLWQTSGTTTNGGGTASGTFSAATRGTATLSAAASSSCASTLDPCVQSLYDWSVTIKVSP